jgi:PadR family transcriptional regulator, regulatory protein PadR
MEENNILLPQLRKGMFEIGVLSLLMNKDMYGYEITEHFNRYPVYQIQNGTIYPILNRITRNGWAVTYWSEESKDKPKRKYYSITDEGREYLERSLIYITELYNVILRFGKESEIG